MTLSGQVHRVYPNRKGRTRECAAGCSVPSFLRVGAVSWNYPEHRAQISGVLESVSRFRYRSFARGSSFSGSYPRCIRAFFLVRVCGRVALSHGLDIALFARESDG